jgi:hypothetical protein
MSERDDDIRDVESEVATTDGAATRRLREVESVATVSRRGVLWRAGLATAVGVAGLTALDQQRADAATGGNFLLGKTNDAGASTILKPTTSTSSNPLMQIDGTAMNATATSLVVKGPAGGVGLSVQGVDSGSTTTIGLALSAQSNGAANGIYGNGGGYGVTGNSTGGTGVNGTSGTGTGVAGTSTSGRGVFATSTSGNALEVSGMTKFSRSGAATVIAGSDTKVVTVAGLTASSLVLVTLQKFVVATWVVCVVPAAGKFTLHLNKNAAANLKFAWFVLSG